MDIQNGGNKMKKAIALSLCGVMLASALAGCSGGAAGTSGGTDTTQETAAGTENANKGSGDSIEFMTGTAIDTALYKEYEKMVEAFAEANPDAPAIELVPSSTDHEGEVKTRLAGGNIPDMWMTHGWSLGRYSEYLVDLKDQAWAADVDPLLQDIMFSEEGSIYALPINVDVSGILYNGDVLAEAGYAPEDIKTWDDFIDCCTKIKENGKVPIYNSGKDRWPTGLYVDWMAPSFMTEEDNQSFADGTFVADKYRQILEMVDTFAKNDFFNPDYSSATSDDISRALAQGETGFAFINNFALVTAYEYAPDANMGFMPIPNVEGGEPYYVCGEKDAIGVAKDGANVDTCLKFLDFLAQPENIAALASSSGQMSGLTTGKADLGALAPSFEQTKNYPGVPYFDRVYMPSGSWDAIVATAEMVVTGQKSVDDALAQIEKEYNTLKGN